MNAVFAIVGAVLAQMRRDRSAVVFLVLLPLGLMVLMGNVYEAEDDDAPRLALLEEPASDRTEAIGGLLADDGRVEVLAVDDRRELDDAVRRRSVDAGLVLDDASSTLVGAPDVAVPGGLRFVVRGAVTRVDRAAALASATGRPLAEVQDRLPAPVEIPPVDGTEARTQAAIGVLVLVTFMNLIAYGSTVPSHRSVGVLARLGAAPANRRSLLAGYAAAFGLVALVQVAVTIGAGRLFVGIEWGPSGQVAVIALALAVGAAGVGTLAATLLPSPESGGSLGGPIGFALGMLGGCLWPLDFVGGVLETIGRWVPHQWAVAALRDAADGVATVGSLAAPVLALTAAGVACVLAGARRLAMEWR